MRADLGCAWRCTLKTPYSRRAPQSMILRASSQLSTDLGYTRNKFVAVIANTLNWIPWTERMLWWSVFIHCFLGNVFYATLPRPALALQWYCLTLLWYDHRDSRPHIPTLDPSRPVSNADTQPSYGPAKNELLSRLSLITGA